MQYVWKMNVAVKFENDKQFCINKNKLSHYKFDGIGNIL